MYTPQSVHNTKLTIEQYTPQSVHDTKLSLAIEEVLFKVVHVSPENGATGISRTPTLVFTEEGEIPDNRFYQIMVVAIDTQESTPDFNEGIKVTQEWTDTVNQEFTFPDELLSQQWYAWKILPKTLPVQAEFIDEFQGDDEPLSNDWETEVLV